MANAAKSADKLNLVKLHKHEYRATAKPVLVDVSDGLYLVVRGRGGPGSPLFQERVEALYAMAYGVKFHNKQAGRDFVVGKLEALYGVDGQSLDDLATLDKADWHWRLLIRVPEFVAPEHLDATRQTLRAKGKTGDYDVVQLEAISEGPCAQVLHVGPYENEAETLAMLQSFVAEQGRIAHRWHHEIYLNDPRRVPAERLRTILRHPVTELASNPC